MSKAATTLPPARAVRARSQVWRRARAPRRKPASTQRCAHPQERPRHLLGSGMTACDSDLPGFGTLVPDWRRAFHAERSRVMAKEQGLFGASPGLGPQVFGPHASRRGLLQAGLTLAT